MQSASGALLVLAAICSICAVRSGKAEPAPSAPALTISLQVEPSPSGALNYKAQKVANSLFVAPDDEDLMDALTGSLEMIYGGYFYADENNVLKVFRAVPLNVTLRNPGRDPIAIKSAYLDVSESRSELQPTYWIDNLPFGICSPVPAYNPRFSLTNYGWGTPTSATLEYAFVEPLDPDKAVSPKVTRAVADSANPAIMMDFVPELARLGVDTKRLEKLSKTADVFGAPYTPFGCSSRNDPTCLGKARRSGTFGSLSSAIELDDRWLWLGVKGTLTYRWADAKGVSQQSAAPFYTKIRLAAVTSVNCGEGVENPEQDPPGKEKIALRLVDGSYRLPIRHRPQIAPGQSIRLPLLLRSPQTSHHRFRIVVEAQDGRRFESQSASLFAFIPSRIPKLRGTYVPYREDRPGEL